MFKLQLWEFNTIHSIPICLIYYCYYINTILK